VNRLRKSAVATGLVAGLVVGGAAGAVLGAPGLSGAQEDEATTTTVAPEQEQGTDEAPSDGPGRSVERRSRAAERLGEALAPLVEDGTIDQAQADAVVEQLLDSEVLRRSGRHGGRGHGFGFGPGPVSEAAAEALGMTEEELRDALREGTTLAEIAEAEGVEVQKVIDALVADASERLDERVADGDLTREQADERLAKLTERITEMVQEGWRHARGGHGPGSGHHGPGFGHEGPDAGPDADEPAEPGD